jgi:hypothetical protein
LTLMTGARRVESRAAFPQGEKIKIQRHRAQKT